MSAPVNLRKSTIEQRRVVRAARLVFGHNAPITVESTSHGALVLGYTTPKGETLRRRLAVDGSSKVIA